MSESNITKNALAASMKKLMRSRPFEKISVSDIVRRIYLYAVEDPSERVQALYRPLAKAGDYLLDHLNRQWQIDAILEDFSAEGWVSVQAVMQPIPQALSIIPDEEVADGNN